MSHRNAGGNTCAWNTKTNRCTRITRKTISFSPRRAVVFRGLPGRRIPGQKRRSITTDRAQPSSRERRKRAIFSSGRPPPLAVVWRPLLELRADPIDRRDVVMPPTMTRRIARGPLISPRDEINE